MRMEKLPMIKDKVLYIFATSIGLVCLSYLFPFMVASPHYFTFVNHDSYLLGWSWAMFLFNTIAVGLTVIFAMVCLFSEKTKNQYSPQLNSILTIAFYFGCVLNFFYAIFITTSAYGDLILHPFFIANYYYTIAYLIAFVIAMIRSHKLTNENKNKANV